MTERTSRRTVIKALGGAATLTGVTGVASAQSNETAETTEEPKPEGIVAQLSETVTLRSWEWEADRSRFALVVDSEMPKRLKITDTAAVMAAMASGNGSGAFEIPTAGRTLQSGKQTVYFSGEKYQNVAAITIATTDGAYLIRTDSIDMANPPVQFGTAGALAGMAAIGSGWYSFRKGREKLEESDEPEVSRIA